MRRVAWVLLFGAVLVLGAGAVHVTLLILEHLRHPEWSAPAYVNLIHFVPYALLSGALALASWWVTRTRPRPGSVASGSPHASR